MECVSAKRVRTCAYIELGSRDINNVCFRVRTPRPVRRNTGYYIVVRQPWTRRYYVCIRTTYKRCTEYTYGERRRPATTSRIKWDLQWKNGHKRPMYTDRSLFLLLLLLPSPFLRCRPRTETSLGFGRISLVKRIPVDRY